MLPSVFDVTGFAAAAVATATRAVAELLAERESAPPRAVTVDRRDASLSFASEALFVPDGWERPNVWDPIAGNYRTSDGWIRLHTNYAYHRAAVERVLGRGAVRDGSESGTAGTAGPGDQDTGTQDAGTRGAGLDRAAVTAAAARWTGHDLEAAVVAEGGCAAVMHSREEWLASAAGAAAAAEPVARLAERPGLEAPRWSDPPAAARPLAGVRVLDLTRVIAGPVATRFLAAYGAEVLRIDPPGFAEVGALLPETTAGKRCAALDLRSVAGRQRFGELVAQADVLVCGLRPDALDRLGLGRDELLAHNPDLIMARLDAYGWSGPWANRRGFDSLVQMSGGIAAAGAAARGQDAPHPLPVQALDHGTGFLIAAAVVRALTRRLTAAAAADLAFSLVGTANVLAGLATPDGLEAPRPTVTEADTVPTDTDWGPGRRIPIPGRIAGIPSRLAGNAGPLGRHEARWSGL